MDSSCGVAGWSIVTSAAPNSGFAGLLAGFLFTGLVFLLGGRQGTEKHSPVIALFSASFLVIAFDSYLFSRVSGFDPNSGEIEVVCKSVWMAAMTASGMLVVGSASLLIGLGYLLVSHDPIGAPYLRRLAIIMGGGVLFGAPSLLLFTSFSFYQHVLRAPSWTHIYFASGVAAALTSIFFLHII